MKTLAIVFPIVLDAVDLINPYIRQHVMYSNSTNSCYESGYSWTQRTPRLITTCVSLLGRIFLIQKWSFFKLVLKILIMLINLSNQ